MNQTNSDLKLEQDTRVSGSAETLSQDNEEIEAPSATTNEIPDFGWSSYAERINGRFAMIGFFAILLVELFSQKASFLEWAGLLN